MSDAGKSTYVRHRAGRFSYGFQSSASARCLGVVSLAILFLAMCWVASPIMAEGVAAVKSSQPAVGSGSEGGDVGSEAIPEDEGLPPIDSFVPVDVAAEMIDRATPAYPRFALRGGLEGVVWVKALVDIEGNVRDAVIGKSSGTEMLDRAALKVAGSNKFRPAQFNGKPVASWVPYRVVFELGSRSKQPTH